jgi:hypothetical protein
MFIDPHKKTHRQPQVPDARQCAILLLMLVGTRENLTRARLSETTLRRLWKRDRLKDDFLEQVQEWLARGGWSLFFAKTTFAVVQSNIVANWPRMSSKRLGAVLNELDEGTFDFDEHADLFVQSTDASDH